jgi:ABC-2 type transport system permease protein
MSNPVSTIISIRLKNQFEFSKLKDKDTSIKTHAVITNVGFVLLFILILTYVATLPYQMKFDNQLEIVNPYIFSLLFWGLGIWALLSGIQNVIYGSDHDQIFVLPIERWQAILINIISQVIVQTCLCVAVVLVSQIALYIVSPFPLINIFLALIYVCIMPLMATGATIIVALLIKIIFHGLKIRNTLLEALFTLIIFISPLLYSYAVLPSFNVKAGISGASILKYSLLEASSLKIWVYSTGLLILVIFGFLLLSGLIVKKYDALVLLVGTRPTKQKQFNLSINSTMVTLLKKEANRYFSSFSYVINTILAPFALLVIGVALGLNIAPVIPDFSVLGLDLSGQSVYYLIFIVCAILTTSTSCSFSMEGKSIWIVQSLPISISELVIAKGLLNVLLLAPGLLIAVMDLWVIFGQRGISFVGHSLLLILSMLLITTVGLFINLRKPSYDWTSEMVVVKQSLPVILTGLTSMVLITVSAAVLLFLNLIGVYVLILVECILISFLFFQMKHMKYL